MDGNLRLRAAHWRSAGPHHPPRPHPGDERRLLPPQAKPPQTSLTSPSQTRLGAGEALPLRSSASPPPKYHFLILYWLPFTPPQWSTFTPPLTDTCALPTVHSPHSLLQAQAQNPVPEHLPST